MNETIRSIKNRRSVRVFSPEPIKEEDLQAIVEAGLFAPSANNEQSWHFTVIQDQALLEELSAAAKEVVKKTGDEHMAGYASNDKFHIFYHAPVAIIVSGAEKALMPQTDCAAATENMLVAAESLNIGSCWNGFISFLFSSEDGQKYRRELGIPDGYQPYYGIALGHKTKNSFNAPPRKEGTVNYI